MFRNCALAAVFVLAPLSTTGMGADYTWNGGTSGSWKTSTNWTPERALPGTSDWMYVYEDQESTCVFDEDREGEQYHTVRGLWIYGNNTFSHSANSLTVALDLGVGTSEVDALATYELSGSADLHAPHGMSVSGLYAAFFDQWGGGTVTTGQLLIRCGVQGNSAVGTYKIRGDSSLTVYRESGNPPTSGAILIGTLPETRGLLEQHAGQVECKALLMGNDGGGGWGEYDMTGGSLKVRTDEDEEGEPDITLGYDGATNLSGRFYQSGGTVKIYACDDGGHGRLLVGANANAGGLYRISGGSLYAEKGIFVGSGTGSRWGRFEWFAGSMTNRNVNVESCQMELGAYGTLAIGFDLYITDLLAGNYFTGGTSNTLTGLDAGALEVTNRATVTHVGSPFGQPPATMPARLNIGGSLEEEVACAGKYQMLNDESEHAKIQTGAIFIGLYEDEDEEEKSELAIGSANSSAQAAFTVTDALWHDQTYISLLFGSGSKFTAAHNDSTAEFEFTSQDAKVVVDAAVSAANMPALAKTSLIFNPYTDDVCTPRIEGAGSAFALKQLTIGGDHPSHRVILTVDDNEDNDGQGQTQVEPLYVETVAFGLHGSVDLNDPKIYFKNGGDWKFLIPGDVNLNGEVTFWDYQILEVNFGTTTGMTWEDGDLDGDCDVDFADYQILETHFGEGQGDQLSGQPLPELRDFDDDGDVDLDDLHTAQELYSEQHPACDNDEPESESPAPLAPLPGLIDLDGDGDVDLDDLLMALAM